MVYFQLAVVTALPSDYYHNRWLRNLACLKRHMQYKYKRNQSFCSYGYNGERVNHLPNRRSTIVARAMHEELLATPAMATCPPLRHGPATIITKPTQAGCRNHPLTTHVGGTSIGLSSYPTPRMPTCPILPPLFTTRLIPTDPATKALHNHPH